MRFLFLILVILVPNVSYSDQIGIKYGPGALHSENSKLVAVGYQKQVYEAFYAQYETGAWFDNEPGRSTSMYLAYTYGFHIDAGHMYAQWFFGPAFISTPDNLLGGSFQFSHDLAFGLQDNKGYSVGLDIKHVSSGGINIPNLGRDYLNIRVGIPF